jgi:hypothetical protein
MSSAISTIKNLVPSLPEVQLSKKNFVISLAAINSGIALYLFQPETYSEKAATIATASVATYCLTQTVGWAAGKVKNQIIHFAWGRIKSEMKADGVEFKENGDIFFSAAALNKMRDRFQQEQGRSNTTNGTHPNIET